MYSIEQRRKIGDVFTHHSRFDGDKAIPWESLCTEILQRTGLRVPPRLMRTVFYGGADPGRTHPAHAHKQDLAISLLASLLNVDMSLFRDSFATSRHLYFPDTPAFGTYRRTWIGDCLDAGALKHLQHACAAAVAGNCRTDGADVLRIKVLTSHQNSIKHYNEKAGAASQGDIGTIERTAAPLPLLVGINPPVGNLRIDVAPSGNGFSIDASKALVKQLEEQGLPTAEIKAAIVQKVTADKSAMERMISAMLGF